MGWPARPEIGDQCRVRQRRIGREGRYQAGDGPWYGKSFEVDAEEHINDPEYSESQWRTHTRRIRNFDSVSNTKEFRWDDETNKLTHRGCSSQASCRCIGGMAGSNLDVSIVFIEWVSIKRAPWGVTAFQTGERCTNVTEQERHCTSKCGEAWREAFTT